MNKDKIIKDLKERNDKLENQRRQFELNYYHEQHIVEGKDKEIEKLKNGYCELKKYLNYMYKKCKKTNNLDYINYSLILDKLATIKLKNK